MSIEKWMQKHPTWRFVPVEDVIYVFNNNNLILMIPNWDWDHD